MILSLILVSENSNAQCLGGKIFGDTSMCSSQIGVLRLKGNTTVGVTYQWQYSNDGGLNFVNVSPAISSVADTLKINVNLTGRQYRCKIVCSSGVAYSDTFFMDYAARTITLDRIICSSTLGGNDSVTLKLTRNFPFIDTATARRFTWEVSNSQGQIWSKINGSLDTIRVKFTSAPLLYRAITSYCNPINPYPNGQISNEFKLGLKPVNLWISDKDCVNDSARLSLDSALDISIAGKVKVNWFSSSKYLPETMRSTHDTFLKVKVDSSIRYYRASLKLCETPFPSVDSAYTNIFTIWPKVGILNATISCPTEQVTIDYENRDSSRISVYTYWKKDTGITVTNPTTLFTDPADSLPYKTYLVNNVYSNYKVYSKFCSNSTNILDSTNMKTVFLKVNGGQLLATSDTCPSDTARLTLVNYAASSNFTLYKKWEYKPYDSSGFLTYTLNPLTDSTIAFRLKKGLTLYRKTTTLCDDKYATKTVSTVASTFLPYRAVINVPNCSTTLVANVLDDTIKITDVNHTIVRNGPFAYQWYSSTDKVNFNPIASGTTKSLTLASGTSNLYYKRVMRQCPASPLEDTTNISNVYVPNPSTLNGKTEIFTEVCLNNYVNIGVTNNIIRAGTPTYIWQKSADEITWVNIESPTANDSVLVELVGPNYIYFRRLTLWCPSNIVDSSKSTPLVYNQPLPWCESFNNMIQSGENVYFNCWRGTKPVCSSYTPTYAGSKIWSKPGSGQSSSMGMSNWGPPTADPPNPPGRVADNKLITPAFYLMKGKIYRFSFWHKENSGNLCWDSLYATWGTKPYGCDIVNKFGDNLMKFNHGEWSKFWADFIPTDTGIYYFGINFRDKDLSTGELVIDDVCLKLVDSCQGNNPVKGATFAPSKIIQRPGDGSGNYDKTKVTHQYCLHDTIMLTYNPNNYNTNFDYFGMKYQFYKKKKDIDWKVNDTFFKPLEKAVVPTDPWDCNVRNRTDYHVVNVLVTDTDTYYKIVATCDFDKKVYHSDSLLVNGTHSLPYCDDWEGVGLISNKPKSDLPNKNSDPILGVVPSFASCPKCWASYPQPPTPSNPLNKEPFYSVTLPFGNLPTTAAPQLFPDGGYIGDDVVINGQVQPTTGPYLRRKLLVFPAVRLYKGRGYRISFRWTDNRKAGGSPYGDAVTQDFDSLYLTVSKGNQSGKTMDSFPYTKKIGLLKKDIKSNYLESGTAKYQTFWVDYQPVDTGTYFFAIVGVANAGTATTNSNPYRFMMDYFCIDTIPIDDCSEKPRFTDPLRIKISPDAKTWPWTIPGQQWCVGAIVNIELDFGLTPVNEWKYGYKMIWERTTDNINWTKYADSTNGISYVITSKYQNFRLRLVNACGIDTIIGPFNVTAPNGILCWTENFENSVVMGMPQCWDVTPYERRVFVNNQVNIYGHGARSFPNYLRHDYATSAAVTPSYTSMTHVPPGFGLKPGTYRFSFWYKDNGISQAYDSLKVGWSYIRANPTVTNGLINTVVGDYVRNSKENKWRYYSAELVAPLDTTYHIKVTDFNIGNKSVYYHLFDDYMMKMKENNDMLVIGVDSPYRACGMSANSTLKVTVMNIGYATQSNVPVRARVDNGPVYTVNLAGPIASNQTKTLLIPNVDLSVPGKRVVKVWTDLATDTVGCKDDTFTTEILNKELFNKPIDTGDTFCKCFPVTYVVNTPNHSANWYATDTSAFPFMANDTISLPSLCRDTCFYVSASSKYSAFTEPHNFSFGSVSYFNATNGLIFDNIYPDTVILKSVVVYAKTAGQGTIRIKQYGTTLYSFTATFPTAGRLTVPIQDKGWKIAPGTDYQIEYAPLAPTNVQLASVGTLSFAAGFGIPGIIRINDRISSANPPNPTIGTKTGVYYHYFYDMEFIIPECESERVKVCLRVKEAPVFKLKDTARVCTKPVFNLCGPDPVPGDVYTYNWSNPSAVTNITKCQGVTQTGWYRLSVTNSFGCETHDSVRIITDPTPDFSLGNDTSFCNKSTHILTTGLDSTENAVVWSNGMSGTSIGIQNPGTLVCTAYNVVNFCSASDTINVTRIELPNVNAGNDRVFCGNSADLGVLLNPNYTYQWFNSAGTAINMPVNSDGKYYVLGTDPTTKCVNSDTIVADLVANPPVDLGPNIDYCGTSVTIGPIGANGNYSYVWNTTSTNRNILVSLPGTYYLTMTDAAYGCQSVDSVNVKFKQIPIFSLGNDVSICATTYSISAPAPYTTGVTYNWNGPKVNNATTNPLVVDTSGTYTLVINNGCYPYSSSVHVSLKRPADSAIDLLPDTAVGCKQVQLTATSNMTGASVQWSTNNSTSRNNSIVIDKSGSYSVSLTNECGAATKSVLVRIDSVPAASFDIVYPSCMSIGLNNTSKNGTTYTWQYGDGTTSNDFSPLYQYTNEGEYIVTLNVTNTCGTSSITKKIDKRYKGCKSSISPNLEASEIVLFPNPTKDKSTILGEGVPNANYHISVRNLLGQLVSVFDVKVMDNTLKADIDMTKVSSGEYIIEIYTDKESIVKKLQVVK